MKVEPFVEFNLKFKGFSCKDKSYKRLQDFLHKTDWLPEECNQDPNLLSYHSESDGTCKIQIKQQPTPSLEELASMFMSDLHKCSDIERATVIWTSDTEGIVMQYMDYCQQLKDSQSLCIGDEVVIIGPTPNHRN